MTDVQNEVAVQTPSARQARQTWLLVIGALIIVAATVIITTVVVRGVPGSAQSSLTPTQHTAVDAASAALGKVNAAVEVGVNFSTYGQLLIDAKAATNHAVEVVPSAPVTQALQEAMQNYVDAAEVWQFKIKYSNLQLETAFGHGPLLRKYGMLTTDSSDDTGVDPNIAMQKIWSFAGANYRQLMSIDANVSSN